MTATRELAVAIDALSKTKSGCCQGGARATTEDRHAVIEFPVSTAIIVEDQFGIRYDLNALLRGRHTVLGFFYTRCMNPAKCSLTVTRLAAIARDLEKSDRSSDLLVLACTYDPDFDVGSQLEAYGRDREFPFRERSMLLRCVEGWDRLRESFRLRVGYSATTVNDHAREVFLVGPTLGVDPISPESLAGAAFPIRRLSNLTVIDIDGVAVVSHCCG